MERTAQPQRLADACTCLSLTHGEPDTCMPGMLLKSSLYLLQMQMQLVMLNKISKLSAIVHKLMTLFIEWDFQSEVMIHSSFCMGASCLKTLPSSEFHGL